jgi:hypothetical protein
MKIYYLLGFILTINSMVLYMVEEGKREGFYYWLKCLANKIEENFKEHNLFSIQRLSVGIVTLFLFLCIFDNKWLAILSTISLWSMFPFIHDNAYYNEREKLVPGTYPKGFENQTVKSNSILDNVVIKRKSLSNPTTRFILFMIGVLSLLSNIIYMIINLK